MAGHYPGMRGASSVLTIKSTAPSQVAAGVKNSAGGYTLPEKQDNPMPEDQVNLSEEAQNLLKKEGVPRGKALSHNPGWVELLSESNDKIRYGIIQLKRISNTQITTPSVVGQTLKDAVHILKAAGLPITKIIQEYSSDVPAGRIILQMPSPGGAATRQMGVAVVVSKGPLPNEDLGYLLRKELVL